MMDITVNGRRHRVEAEPAVPLLYVLRNELGLNGPRFGCGLAQCGACTVHVDGKAVKSCTMFAVQAVSSVAGKGVTTLEGLGALGRLHPVQQAFVDEQAAQCGYCVSGMIMTTAALLKKTARPTEAQIRTALAGNLCRCGTHMRILRAVRRAARA